MSGDVLSWSIAALTILAMLWRPRGCPEWCAAVAGAAASLFAGLVSPREALQALARGDDVYWFLIGMMLLSELARAEGLFDWLAAHAVARAQGSPSRLFAWVYGVGVVVTVFLSNDATAVVLTPAVYAATRRAGVPALPYLYICAFVANAASFVLPISNPANLVVFAGHVPALKQWLGEFALASLVAILATFVALRVTQRRHLRARLAGDAAPPAPLNAGARIAGLALCATCALLLGASWFDRALGMPTLLAGLAAVGGVSAGRRRWPRDIFRGVSWSVLPLVGALFVLVASLENTQLLTTAGLLLTQGAQTNTMGTAWSAGVIAALGCNVANNLPVGLGTGSLISSLHLTSPISGALLIGVDLGPNLSVSGSLATLLWLVALRREGVETTPWAFLRVGMCVMPPALILTLAGYLLAR